MAGPAKIATCCYCGARTALVLTTAGRHELSCGSCGAPLHEMKRLVKARVQDHEVVGPSPSSRRPRKAKPKKRRKGLFSKLIEEAFDAVEDIFD